MRSGGKKVIAHIEDPDQPGRSDKARAELIAENSNSLTRHHSMPVAHAILAQRCSEEADPGRSGERAPSTPFGEQRAGEIVARALALRCLGADSTSDRGSRRGAGQLFQLRQPKGEPVSTSHMPCRDEDAYVGAFCSWLAANKVEEGAERWRNQPATGII